MSFMAGLGGAAAGAAGGLFGSLVSGGFNARQAAKAYERNVDAYKHRYQWARQDLEAAGYNPILALGGGAGAVGSAPSATMPDAGGVTSNASVGAKLALEKAALRQGVAESRARERKTDAEASYVGDQRRLVDQQIVGQAVTNALSGLGVNKAAQEAAFWASGPGKTAQSMQLGGGNMTAVTKSIMETVLGGRSLFNNAREGKFTFGDQGPEPSNAKPQRFRRRWLD